MFLQGLQKAFYRRLSQRMPSSVLVALCCTSHKTLALRVLEHACICAKGGITCLCNICFRFAIRKSKAKRTSNHWFLKVFGGPRPSKTASKDPKRLPRGYLGLLEAILAETVFVYERSEGLAELLMII